MTSVMAHDLWLVGSRARQNRDRDGDRTMIGDDGIDWNVELVYFYNRKQGTINGSMTDGNYAPSET